jgi:hypothetical protein
MQTDISTTTGRPSLKILNGKALMDWLNEPDNLTDDDRKAYAEVYADNPDLAKRSLCAETRQEALQEARDEVMNRWRKSRDDWEEGDAPWVYIPDPANVEASLTRTYDPSNFFPILTYDSSIFTEDETGMAFDDAMDTFFEEIGNRFTFHVTATDRTTGRTVYERKLSSGFVGMQRWQLTAEVERFIADYDGYVDLTFHAAPLPTESDPNTVKRDLSAISVFTTI